MEFTSLLSLIGNDPVFESSLLLSGKVDPKLMRFQLARWVNRGRLLQVRRGLYAIAPPYRKTLPHPFLVANQLKRASYISLQSALAFFGMIPDVVRVTTSVTTSRPQQLVTPLGDFEFRHVNTRLLFGYRMLDLGGQTALVATPEKALLDLIYLTSAGDSPAYLQELRLQNTHQFDLEKLHQAAELFDSPKMRKAVDVIAQIIQAEITEYEAL